MLQFNNQDYYVIMIVTVINFVYYFWCHLLLLNVFILVKLVFLLSSTKSLDTQVHQESIGDEIKEPDTNAAIIP